MSALILLRDEMFERKCKGCDSPSSDHVIIEKNSEYCTLCEWDGKPYIDGLQADNARLLSQNKRFAERIVYEGIGCGDEEDPCGECLGCEAQSALSNKDLLKTY